MHLNLKKLCLKAGLKAAVTLITISMVTFAFVSVVSTAPGNTFGDVNKDGQTDVRDVVLIQQHILGIVELSEDQLKLADVSGDGVVDVQDVTITMQHVLKIEPFSRTISATEAVGVNVSVNTAVESVPFPDIVQATLDEGSVMELNVEWEDSSVPTYAKDEVGDYLFEGELVNLPQGITNPEGLKAQAVITVVEEDAPLPPDSDQYSLSLVVDPSFAGLAVGSGDYEESDVIQVSVQDINPAYEFVSWTQDDSVVSNDVSFDFEMPAENTILVANFNLTDGETFSELGGEITQVIVGVYNVAISYSIADSTFPGITQSSTIILSVVGKDPLVLEYNEVRDAFFKPAVQGYSETEIENSQVIAD